MKSQSKKRKPQQLEYQQPLWVVVGIIVLTIGGIMTYNAILENDFRFQIPDFILGIVTIITGVFIIRTGTKKRADLTGAAEKTRMDVPQKEEENLANNSAVTRRWKRTRRLVISIRKKLGKPELAMGRGISLLLFVVLMFAFVSIVMFMPKGDSNDAENEGIYYGVMNRLILIVSVGFIFCAIRSSYRLSDFRNESEFERRKQTPVFSTIFGVVAGLAITTALTTYYANYISIIQSNLDFNLDPMSFQTGNFTGGLVTNASWKEVIVPTLHLVEFFALTIPITHSAYVFLASFVIEHVRDKKDKTTFKDKINKLFKNNAPFALVSVFVISIIQLAFVFFLSGSIAIPFDPQAENSTSPTDPQPVSSEEEEDSPPYSMQTMVTNVWNKTDQSNAFVFWLTLTAIMATLGSIVAHIMVRTVQNRIPWEWIMLNAFTIGFLLTAYWTIFQTGLITNISQLLYFHWGLIGVLISRAVLDYLIGRRIYFPETYSSAENYFRHRINKMELPDPNLTEDLTQRLAEAKQIVDETNKTRNINSVYQKLDDFVAFVKQNKQAHKLTVDQADELEDQADKIKKVLDNEFKKALDKVRERI